MTGEMLLKHLELVRANALRALESTTEEMADAMPAGFRNTIRWNLGHIYNVDRAPDLIYDQRRSSDTVAI